jgi:Cu/Ag efflux pump CusA
MNVAQQRLPTAVVPVIGPDATALGQVFWYTVEAEGFDLAELRSIQDWYLRYQLNSVDGVSEVASIGGFVKQYQIRRSSRQASRSSRHADGRLRGRAEVEHRRGRKGAGEKWR